MCNFLISTFTDLVFQANPLVALGALVGGATLLSGLFNSISNRHATKEANRSNYRLFQEGNQYNTEMWEKTNAYNTPAAQLQRLQAAGLNPLLHSVDGGNASMQTSTTANPQQPAPFDSSFIGDAVQQGVSTFQNAQDLNSQMRLREEQRAKLVSETMGQNLDNMGKIIDNEYKPREKKEMLDNLSKQNQQLAASTALTRQQTYESETRVAQAKKQLEIMAKDLELKDEEKKSMIAARFNQQRLTDAQVHKLNSAAALDFANVAVASAQEGYINEQTFYVKFDNAVREYAKSAYQNIPFEQLNIMRRQAYLLYEQGYNEVIRGNNLREATNKISREIQNMDLTDSERLFFQGVMNMISLGTAAQSSSPTINGYGASMIQNSSPWYKGFTTP